MTMTATIARAMMMSIRITSNAGFAARGGGRIVVAKYGSTRWAWWIGRQFWRPITILAGGSQPYIFTIPAVVGRR